MIYDCFTLFNEIELLEIRLNELNSVVDKFVIVESDITFSGIPKKYFFEENKDKFLKYIDKIIYIKIKSTNYPKKNLIDPNIIDTSKLNPKIWSREIFQRNSILQGLKDAKADDLILIGDIDEIPNKQKFHLFKKSLFKSAVFKQSLYYYYLNCYSNYPWYGTKAVLKKYLTTPQEIRTSSGDTVINNGGWHFSFLGGVIKIQEKINSFSHQELNNSELNNIRKLKFNIDNNLDIFERPIKFKTVKIDKKFPLYIQKNTLKYRHLIKKIPKTSNNENLLQNEIFNLRQQFSQLTKDMYHLQEQLKAYNTLNTKNSSPNSKIMLIKKISQKIKKIINL